ncbi:adenosylmethionine--8-amino-7-oxononanoate transaminase [Leptospira gomenensis]|uniref:Adenosylmethionine-8-amino-7-oxononanoate aminotransferase n=1 Tax=Leptospira gomenensis TaxID=2484974 RepID=A0A5F1YST6_9LEPT|nr:adenosylmethionine--8-amino-7-oxononanoate transaminase [Leptospira gomenensis]TGK35170.1 adenosylmethionine--8-amino-7-oxononanoate transaminase [Leptospira gomenensis]TGK35877.1 adenosylmethionine--8-amino-7-oxononanoate transaminase [Leptospira gomenensis]TGK41032.1 adenosylmethionine--8-amino-7-oxononanoate transaminase [Leptospira gomenensis]TGK61261.1 adenosylmethionine--8-amino-7-oxononanoate transaminase [Leptospira gomenensis]
MIWYPFTLQYEPDSPVKIVRGEKEFLYDEGGNSYIDAISSWWANIHGHNHPKIIQAIRDQLDRLDHVLLAGFTHEPAETLAAQLMKITDGLFHKVLYSDNGSSAVEIMIKLAYQYFRNIGQSERTTFIKWNTSYHGDTIGAMSVGGDSVFNRVFSGLLFPTKEFPAPNCNFCPVGKLPDSCRTECLRTIEEYLEAHPNEVAGIVIEPLILGSGGMVFYQEEVLRSLERTAKKYGAFLLVDEVFTGFGRTGSFFAYQRAGIRPDLIAVAKGLSGGSLPIAATLVCEKIHSAFVNPDPEKGFYHGHTMTGNPLACRAALASIELLQEPGFLKRVQELEKKINVGLESLEREFPHRIRNRRVLGAVGVLELEVGSQAGYTYPGNKILKKKFLEKGVLLRPLGNVLYLAPPYSISDSSLEKVFNAIRQTLSETDLGK